MGKSILVTGGARSGKSSYAESLVLGMGPKLVYIATAEAHDAEMQARIEQHRARRDARWTTVNAPFEVLAALDQTDGCGPRLLDCVTLWLSNLMLADRDWEAELDTLCAGIASQSDPVVLVTNEVGSGIVPASSLGRQFRDAAGYTNQRIASTCDELWLCVAGQPLRIKPK